MIILPDQKLTRTKILKPGLRKQHYAPSGTEHFYMVRGRLHDGYIKWRGRFEDREDADAFLYAVVTGNLIHEPELWKLPVPEWNPDLGTDLVYECITYNIITTGTTWTVPVDWTNGSNAIEGIGAGGGSSNAGGAGMGVSGAGGAYAKEVNQTYTASNSITVQVGIVTNSTTVTDTFVKNNSNSANVMLADGAALSTAGTAANSTGSTKYSGGAGGSNVASALYGGAGGGGAAGPGGAGGNGSAGSTSAGGAGGTGGGGSGGSGGAGSTTNGSKGSNGSAGTEWSSAGSGGGGGGGLGFPASCATAGNYGGGGGGNAGGGTGTEGTKGVIVISYAIASNTYLGNIPNMGL